MTRNKVKIQRLTLAAFFVAIELIMGFTPIGYIPLGVLSITTMHIPVILAGVLFGPSFGAGMGFVFALTSFLGATLHPGLTSFVFTPFVSVGNMHGNFFSLLICFGPRILLGWMSGVMYAGLYKRCNRVLAASVTAVVNTMIHTLLVLGGIYVFFAEPYAQALGTNTAGVAAVLLGVIASNGIVEAVFAGIAIPALVRALRPAAERMGILYVRGAEAR